MSPRPGRDREPGFTVWALTAATLPSRCRNSPALCKECQNPPPTAPPIPSSLGAGAGGLCCPAWGLWVGGPGAQQRQPSGCNACEIVQGLINLI